MHPNRYLRPYKAKDNDWGKGRLTGLHGLLICPECGHEWQPGEAGEQASEIRDSVGNVLKDSDTVSVVKVGTKVRGIRLVDGDHDIDCKIPGIGQMGLKSQFVKKVSE